MIDKLRHIKIVCERCGNINVAKPLWFIRSVTLELLYLEGTLPKRPCTTAQWLLSGRPSFKQLTFSTSHLHLYNMSSTVLRPAARLSQTLRRLSSTQATSTSNTPASTSLPKVSLAPEKLRALVSLYHKSDRFITPETLDKHIDAEFDSVIFYGGVTECSYSRLHGDFITRKREPQLGRTGLSANRGADRWSDMATARQRMVRAALYGMEGERAAGAEVLLDERERLAKHRHNDQSS